MAEWKKWNAAVRKIIRRNVRKEISEVARTVGNIKLRRKE